MTELVWEGKYKDGKKVAPVRIALGLLDDFRTFKMEVAGLNFNEFIAA